MTDFQPLSTTARPEAGAGRSRFKKLRYLALTLVSLGLILALWQAPVVKPTDTDEIRGVWMTNYGATLMYHTTRLDETVANLAHHHLNTVYPAVWNRGYTLHPSPVVKQAGGPARDRLTSLPLIPFQDVLAGLVHQAHRQHLRLIPWFEYGLLMPTGSALAQAHPDWLTTTAQGELIPGYATPPQGTGPLGSLKNLRLEMAGATQAWLNPFHPEVQQFLTDLIVDVVQRYPVDGIQLDDHFGLPIAFGYDPYTVNLYQAEHGGASPPLQANDPEWMAWRAEKLTQLMGQIATAVKAERPDAIVSLSPNAPDFAYRKYLQDWTRWVELGWVDEVVVQVYRPELAALEAELYDGGFRDLRDRVAIGLYTGPFLDAKPVDHVRQEVEIVRAAGYRGVSFFCWETTLWWFKGGSADQVGAVFRQLFGA